MHATQRPDDLSQWVRCSTSEVPAELRHVLSVAQWRWLVRRRFTKGLSAAFTKVGARSLICHPGRLAEIILAGALDSTANPEPPRAA